MKNIFVYADNSVLAGEMLSFARQFANEVSAICFSHDEAKEIIKYGAGRVFVVNDENPWAENYAEAIANLLRQEGADLFLVGGTVRGRDLAARTAAYAKCGMVSEATKLLCVDGNFVTDRIMYGGTVVVTEVLHSLSVVTIAAGKGEAVKDDSREGTIIDVDVPVNSRVRVIAIDPIKRETVDISKAKKIVCVGLGLSKKDDLRIAADLAERLQAEVACSRGVAEERHWLPLERYIGISGATVRPDLYLSMGVSGQIQHIVGMRESKLVVAVNTDERAPIFQAADYGIVGDLYEVIPLLTKALEQKEGQ